MKNKKGFTLIELMVSVALFSMMMLLVGMVMQRGEAQTNMNENQIVIQDNLRQALYGMGQEIRESSPSQVSITNNGGLLTLRIPASVNNSGSITWSNPITYQVGGTGRQLVRSDTGSGRNTILANNIQSVTFNATGVPAATITYSVIAQRTLRNGRVLSVTSTGEARLRNT